MSPEFSIIIPTYNNLPLFKRALESVRCQKGASFEVVVVDDSYNNKDIERFVQSLNDSRISYCHNIPPLGAVYNWNYGLQLCKGQYLLLLHHDESLGNDYCLAQAKKLLITHDIVIGKVEVHSHEGKIYKIAPKWFVHFVLRHPSLLFAVNIIGPTATMVFRKEILQPFDTQVHWFVDVEWYYRMLKSSKKCFCNRITIISHHGHLGQITMNIDTTSEAKKDAVILKNKYCSNKTICLAMWVYIHIIHNTNIRSLTKTLLKR